MAADCEQIRGRMLELLYGELAPEARAEVQGHVAGCEACRAELAALESTRAMARRALAAEPPPPSRAREAILRAAAAATRARPATVPSTPSFWARLRGRWTLPTFATIGAVAVFLLASRIFLEPEKTYQRGKAGLVPAEAPATTAPPAEAPAPAEKKREEVKRGEARPPASEAQPAAKPARPAARRRLMKADAPAASSAEGEFAPPPPRRDLDEGLLDKAVPSHDLGDDDMEEAAKPAKKTRSEARSEASEPRGPAPAPPPPAGAFAAPPPPTPAATSRAAAPRAAAKTEAPLDDLASQRAGSGAASDRESSPTARADRLFAQHRWAEAATAYRQLLRDDPTSANAPRWRQRLAACEAAQR